MGLSRNKVAVPEGAAGTPPFWRDVDREVSSFVPLLHNWFVYPNNGTQEKDEAEPRGEVELVL